MGRGQKPAKSKEAKLPVARKSPKNARSKVRDLEKRLAEALQREAEALKRETEALERETATSGILRVISNSPTDTQPVLDAVAESTARLCGADDAVIQQVDDGALKLVAHFGGMPTKQVLLNLLSNAIKFTPEGGRIELAAVSKDGLGL